MSRLCLTTLLLLWASIGALAIPVARPITDGPWIQSVSHNNTVGTLSSPAQRKSTIPEPIVKAQPAVIAPVTPVHPPAKLPSRPVSPVASKPAPPVVQKPGAAVPAEGTTPGTVPVPAKGAIPAVPASGGLKPLKAPKLKRPPAKKPAAAGGKKPATVGSKKPAAAGGKAPTSTNPAPATNVCPAIINTKEFERRPTVIGNIINKEAITDVSCPRSKGESRQTIFAADVQLAVDAGRCTKLQDKPKFPHTFFNKKAPTKQDPAPVEVKLTLPECDVKAGARLEEFPLTTGSKAFLGNGNTQLVGPLRVVYTKPDAKGNVFFCGVLRHADGSDNRFLEQPCTPVKKA